MIVIDDENIKNALMSARECEDVEENDLSGFRVWLFNRLDAIIAEEARKYTGKDQPGFA